ncbi:hypothetical protein F5I97DRAFT_113044 [Phlebopus sp. FC_14]|nr:hypothetical protein F5I97DRAFT_113044 [Phlebopus sp. FC_14]
MDNAYKHDSWDRSPFLPLPLDILFDIVIHLPLQSVLRLRQTSKSFYAVTRLRSLWTLLFRIHVQEKNLPYPDLGERSLDSLPTIELEDLTRRAVMLRHNWSLPEPILKHRVDFIRPIDPDSRIIFLQFLPGRSNRWLISVSMTARPRKYLLQCWDVAHRPQPKCVAELTHVDGPYGGVVVNSDPSSPAAIAMQSAQTEIFSIDFEEDDPEFAFVTLDAIDGVRELHLLSGSTLITRHLEDGGPICIWDLDDLEREKLQLLNPSLLQHDKCQAMHLKDDYVVVIRVQTVEIYSSIPRPNLLPIPGAPVTYPLAQYRFQWRTDTVNISEQVQGATATGQQSRSPPPLPLNVFIRFASIYPWPVNILHHYVLAPNPMYVRDRETTQYNLPYHIQPRAIQTIGSPVRLFGLSTLALGRYGTVLWLDNHTQDWLGPSELGQRLAGKMLDPLQGLVRAAPAEQIESSRASMVFCVSEDDTWNRVAMDEESGRIAIGYTNGAITLLEYASM